MRGAGTCAMVSDPLAASRPDWCIEHMFDILGGVIVACTWLPHFELRVHAAGARRSLAGPLLLVDGTVAGHPVRDASAEARAAGVVPGMTLSVALGCEPAAHVIERDAARSAAAAEVIVQRLESIGCAVQPLEAGRAMFAVDPLEMLYGGRGKVASAVMRSLTPRPSSLITRPIPEAYRPRIGMGGNPFTAWVAARMASPGSCRTIDAPESASVLAPMSLSLLPADDRFLELMGARGQARQVDSKVPQ